jgi:hypothetical protein
MSAVNGIVGDDYGVELPQGKPVEDRALIEEKKIAKYSKSKEFQRIKEYFQSRIEWYQKNLPDGREIGSTQPTSEDWRVANLLIKEFTVLTKSYESIAETVEEKTKNE